MFRIRPEHMEGLAEKQVEGFVERMVAHLREVFPDKVEHLDNPQLVLIVRRGFEIADAWGIDQEEHVERWLELLVTFPELRRTTLPQWVNEIITYPGRSGEDKLLRLEDRLLFRAGE